MIEEQIYREIALSKSLQREISLYILYLRLLIYVCHTFNKRKYWRFSLHHRERHIALNFIFIDENIRDITNGKRLLSITCDVMKYRVGVQVKEVTDRL